MTTTWYTSNLPNDQTDLDKLVQKFREHDPDWIADALWLRYLKIGRQIYQLKHSDLEWEIREAQFDQLLSIKKKNMKVGSPPPLAFDMLPEIPPRDGINHLSALPRDVRVEILSHLRLPDARMNIYGNSVAVGHAFGNLALVSKGRRDQVEAFCGHSLLVWKHEAEARVESGDASNWVGWRELATYTSNARSEWVFRTRRYCGVCVYDRRDSCGCRKSGRGYYPVTSASLMFVENHFVRILTSRAVVYKAIGAENPENAHHYGVPG